MLGRRLTIKDNQRWVDAFEDSVKTHSLNHIERITEDAIKRIRSICPQYHCCSGWVGGKDSIVLHDVLLRSGVVFSPIIWRGVNEWEMMRKWIEENAPHNIIMCSVDKFTFEFLEKNPEFLFCQGNTRQKWLQAKFNRYNKDIVDLGYNMFITGRRVIEGNVCGSKKDGYIVKGKYFTTFNPLAEWTHEEVLAYIRYHNLSLPPIYGLQQGFRCGSVSTGEWTEYACFELSEKEVWDEIYAVEPRTVINASKHLTSARRYLEAYIYDDGNVVP